MDNTSNACKEVAVASLYLLLLFLVYAQVMVVCVSRMRDLSAEAQPLVNVD